MRIGRWNASLLESRVFQPEKSTHSQQASKGHVWQHESFDQIVRSETGQRGKALYVCENPVRAGLAKSPDEYRWLWRSWLEGKTGRPPGAAALHDVESSPGRRGRRPYMRRSWCFTRRADRGPRNNRRGVRRARGSHQSDRRGGGSSARRLGRCPRACPPRPIRFRSIASMNRRR